MLNRRPDADPTPRKAYGRLQFDSAFVDVTAIASVTWIVTLLVRTLAKGPPEEGVLRRLDDLGKQLAEHTKQAERVGRIVDSLKGMAEDLAHLKERSREPEPPGSGLHLAEETSGDLPDLLLIVHQSHAGGPVTLSFQLKIQKPELGLILKRFSPVSFNRDPFEYFTSLFETICSLPDVQVWAAWVLVGDAR